MNKYVNRILLIVIVLCTIIASLLGIRIALNKNFIRNYPDASQEYKLVVLSMFNYYEPYIALYNYGNYYYKSELYEEAANKYKEALKYKIPKKRVCEVEINLALSLIKQSEGERKKDRIKELLHEAQTHLNRCMNLNVEMPDDDNDNEKDTNQKNAGNTNSSSEGNLDGGDGNKGASGDSSGSGNGTGDGDGNGSGKGDGSGSGEGDGSGKASDSSSSASGKGNVDGSGQGDSSGSGKGFGDGDGTSSGKGSGTSASIGYPGRSIDEQQQEAKDISNEVSKSLEEMFNDHLDEINGQLPSDEEWKKLMESKSDAIGQAEMSAASKAAASSSQSQPTESNPSGFSMPQPSEEEIMEAEAKLRATASQNPSTGYGSDDRDLNIDTPDINIRH